MKTNKIRWAAALLLVLAAGCGGGGNGTGTTPGASRLLATSAIAAPSATDYTALVQQLYLSYFGRPADTAGLASFQNQLLALGAPSDIAQLSQAYHSNPAIKALVDSFGISAESAALFSGDNVAFITAIYQNLFNRAPDNEGLAFWAGALDNGSISRANASLSILSGALANASTQGKIDATLINRKVTVGSNFTLALSKAPVNGYNGDKAAAQARALLKNVSATSVTTAFDGTIATLVTSLAETLGQALAPTARAGVAQSVRTGAIVALDGSASTAAANRSIVRYTWTMASKPAGSVASLLEPSNAKPSFTADMAGNYVLGLVVNDGNADSASSAVTITATAATPIADSGKYTCSTLTHTQAVELFYQGHGYLDRDHDGKPCEVYDILAERATATTVTAPSTSTGTGTSTGNRCYVSGYTRKNGTRVSGYYRSC